jgi:hypothetical protein
MLQMSDSTDQYTWFAKNSAVPIARIRYYPTATPALIAEIECGVLFILAWWSAKALMAFRTLTEVLATVDPDGKLEFLVVDTDGCPEIYDIPEFKSKIHGWGEAAWVRHGQILFTSGLGYHPECFDANSRRLLEQC